MGTGIAQIAATVGLNVILTDVSDTAVEKGLEAIKGNLGQMVSKGEKEAALARIR